MGNVKKIVLYTGILFVLSASVFLSGGYVRLVEKCTVFCQEQNNPSGLQRLLQALCLNYQEDSSTGTVNCHPDFDSNLDFFISMTGSALFPPLETAFLKIDLSSPKLPKTYLDVNVLPPGFNLIP